MNATLYLVAFYTSDLQVLVNCEGQPFSYFTICYIPTVAGTNFLTR